MPYIDSESGNIEEDLKLNRNYIGSVIKSAVQTYMWKHCKGYLPGDTAYCFVYDNVEDARKACQQMIDNSSRTVRLSNPMGVIGELISKKVVKEMNENDIIKKKYGLENSFPTQYMCYFEDNIKESILILMERSEVCKKKINHYEYILDRLREGKSEEYKLENYIKTKDAANQSWLTLDKIITLNPDADNNIEYKYNPDDFIIGNKIELSTIVLEEKIEMATDLISAGISAALIKTEEFIDVLTEYSAQSWDFLKEEGGEIIDESRDYLETSYQDLKEGIEILPEKLAPYQKQINDYRSSIKGEAVRFISSLSEKTKNIIQELPDSREINENFRNLIKRVYDLDILKDAATIVTDLDNQLSSQKPFRAVIHEDQDLKEVIINYSTGDEENIISRLCLAAGLPNEDFARAEIVYRMKVKEDRKNGKNDNSYSLQGHTLGGALAAYAGIMSDAYMSAFSPEDGSDQDPESEVNENKSSSSRTNYQVINLNGMGPGNFLDFRGNEFFGYKIGIYYFLEKELNQNYTPDTILYELIERGVIVNGNISNEFRKNVGQNLNVEKMKRVLVEIIHDVLPFELADAEEFVSENFNPLIIERKMRFVESYRKYQARVGDGIDNIINYITSDCFPARLMKQVGASYIVDQKLKQLDPHIDEGFLKRAMMIKQSELEGLINPKLDLFQPFMHLIPSVLQKAENRLREKAVIGNMTDSLSLDYLSSLVKDIICDLKSKDQDILKKLFRYHRLQSPLAMLEVIKDRLRHSMRLQKRIYDDDSIYKSSYFKENLDLFTEEDKIYSLAAAALEQLDKRMSFIELDQLYKWELTGQGIELVLCGQEDDENNKGGNSSNDNTSGSGDSKNSSKMEITYHSSDSAQKFDNKEKRLKIECDQPSANRIYGSVKKGRYIEKRDNEYLCKDNHIYQFNNTQGTGFEILSAYTKVDSKIKVDGQDIDNVYQEKDREEADIGSRIKTLQDTYFGDNIILRNKERLYDQLTGDLIYIYGPGKKDQLTIEGFENGDYGIELKEKAKEKSDNRELHTYTDYKIKIDPFEFVILDHFEIKRELYEHTEVFIKGAVRKEDAGRYFKTLLQEDVEIEITYDNDDRNILFKGIIEKFDFSHDYQNYYLELKARSCSVLLERRRPNRIFQNQGTSYNQVFSKLMEDNTEFNIAFADSSTGDTSLISEDYPLVLQYKESEWDFIKRLSSYMQQVVIVDDTKNKQEKINIQAGYHKNSVARDLNNISGSESRKTGKKNTKYKYYRVEDHQHYRSDNIFQVGKKVNYRLNNSSDDKVELVIIKNRIHIKNQRLCSDFTLVREEDVNLLKTLRERPIEGSGFRAEVVQVNNKYQVKVRFLEIDDDFMEDKAHWFPMDQIYTTAFFAPEVGDIVDIYFKGRNEKYASMKSSTSDEERVIDHNPVDKLIRTPENYRLKLNNEGILFASNKDKSVMDLKEKDTTLNSNKSRIKLEVDKISLNCKNSTAVVDGKKIQLAFGGKGIKVSNGKINMS
ncbi:MAG: contractile injection system protein, VgrG/Pvc8 family [Bacillota bacterium]